MLVIGVDKSDANVKGIRIFKNGVFTVLECVPCSFVVFFFSGSLQVVFLHPEDVCP